MVALLNGPAVKLPWTTKVVDTFTEASDTAIASHTPDTDVEGGGWADLGSWVVRSATGLDCGTTDWGRHCAIDLGAENMRVDSTFELRRSNEQVNGLILRHDGVVSDSANGLAVLGAQGSGAMTAWEIFDLDPTANSSGTSLGFVQTPGVSVSDGETIRMVAQMVHNQLAFTFPELGDNWFTFMLTGASITKLGAGSGHTHAGVIASRQTLRVWDSFTGQVLT